MERAILDTDIFSEVLRGRNATIKRRSEAYLAVFGHFTLSVVAVLEQVQGYQLQDRKPMIDTLLTEISRQGHEVLSLDTDTAVIAGRMFADLRRAGQPIGQSDPLAAAIAVRHDLALVTGNTAHFERL